MTPVDVDQRDAGPKVSVVTIARGRIDHLDRLLVGLSRQSAPVPEVVVVEMGGPSLASAVSRYSGASRLVPMAIPDGDPLPLAAARNAGADRATGEVLVFLDVDCVPGVDLVASLVAALGDGGTVASAQVSYLPPGSPADEEWTETDLRRAGRFHPVRPEVRADAPLAAELFWSLAFGVRREDFDRVGRFDEGFVGYGAEDTDFGLRAAAAGLRSRVSADAVAYHQHHVSYEPPLQHLDDLVTNARVFRDRWQRWAMEGWLAAMAEMGIIEWTESGDRLRVLRRPTARELEAARVSGTDAVT